MAGARARARARARAWAGAWAWARARAWAGAWAGAGAGAWAWAWARAGARAGAGARRRGDVLDRLMLWDLSQEEGEMVWGDCVPGVCVLIEMPSRWYCGVVETRTQFTVRLSPCLCGHDLGDFGMFLSGRISDATELTPMPRAVELNLNNADSTQTYPRELFDAINRRTHGERGEK